ncbi:glutamate--cysteine ligase [Streptomyces zhaozhouensis]|uniref:Glutamate--cysteine ligase EgtA n=1 Tax=Streptomyces zhaozhouensis TaxID=1300267 RepID=A0A286DY22_9ACTN|nr:glutamate-cysteine ligase family protein [Streptomyces zhaozhouensis]SOD63530.1 glutamate--cysteine ligase [Streptomyces zhaozhouensis]
MASEASRPAHTPDPARTPDDPAHTPDRPRCGDAPRPSDVPRSAGPVGPVGPAGPAGAPDRSDEGARPLGESEALAHVAARCLTPGPPTRTGVELEWLVRRRDDPAAAVPPDASGAALARLTGGGRLPGGGRLTREPGGQVEISSAPAASLAACVAATRADLERLRAALADAGLAAGGLGLDPFRDPPRVLDHPRYRAMERFFDRQGPAGRLVMRATASVQISLDAGEDTEGPHGYRARWVLAHRLGPVLTAAFANSPLRLGRPTGWRSTRQALWARVDPGRTRPATPGDADGEDPRALWARYALDASLLCVRRPAPASWNAPPAHSFRSWLRGRDTGDGRGTGGRRPLSPGAAGAPADAGPHAPGRDDLDYHLGTLFPPVRPRGWLELRMIDAQPDDGWIVPLAVAAALMDDRRAAEAAWRATEPLTRGRALPALDVWLRAARHGPSDPEIGPAVRACFAAADAALARQPGARELRDAVGAFADRYAERGRCPADDQLDALEARAPGRTAPTAPQGRRRHPRRLAAQEATE